MNTTILYPLLRPVARAVRWLPLLAGGVLGLAVVAVPVALTSRLTGTQLTDLVRAAATCVALGTAFLLDDPAARSTPTVPVARLTRNLVRVAVAVPAIALWWAVTLSTTPHLRRGALTVEAAALVAAALALAATIARYTGDGTAGVYAAPAVLVLGAVVWFLPRPVALAATPDDPHWTVAHHRWAVVLGLAVVAFVWASREA